MTDQLGPNIHAQINLLGRLRDILATFANPMDAEQVSNAKRFLEDEGIDLDEISRVYPYELAKMSIEKQAGYAQRSVRTSARFLHLPGLEFPMCDATSVGLMACVALDSQFDDVRQEALRRLAEWKASIEEKGDPSIPYPPITEMEAEESRRHIERSEDMRSRMYPRKIREMSLERKAFFVEPLIRARIEYDSYLNERLDEGLPKDATQVGSCAFIALNSPSREVRMRAMEQLEMWEAQLSLRNPKPVSSHGESSSTTTRVSEQGSNVVESAVTEVEKDVAKPKKRKNKKSKKQK